MPQTPESSGAGLASWIRQPFVPLTLIKASEGGGADVAVDVVNEHFPYLYIFCQLSFLTVESTGCKSHRYLE